MSREEIMERLKDIFIDVLENPLILINNQSTASDIPGWDSLNHIMLIVEIEKKFKIRFTAEEAQSFVNVGEMCDEIQSKIKNGI